MPSDPQTADGDVRVLMVDCTRTILTAIREGLPQREIASDYGLSIISEAHGADTPDWSAINRAIVTRWSVFGLKRIKRDAWKIANRAGVSMSCKPESETALDSTARSLARLQQRQIVQ